MKTKLLKVKDIAEALNVSHSKVYSMAKKDEIKCIMLGSSYRFPEDAITKLLSIPLEVEKPITTTEKERVSNITKALEGLGR